MKRNFWYFIDWDEYKVTSKGKKGEESGDYGEEEQYLDPEDPNFVVSFDL